MKAHPIADLFPLLEGDELDSLVLSMRTHGYDPTHPVIVHEGLILDGRNRARAADLAGVPIVTREWTGGDPWDFVWRENAVRRHLDAGQKAAIHLAFAEGSEAWQRERAERLAAANRARSETQAGRPKERAVSRDTARGDVAPVTPQTMSAIRQAGRDGRLIVRDRDRMASSAGVSPATMARAIELRAKAPDSFEAVKRGEIPLSRALSEAKRVAVRAELEDVAAVEAKAVSGVYDVIVLDPPWPMEKIERDVRPNQVAFDYPTMSEEQLAALDVPCAEDCHVWVWTTQKFLPMALRLLEAWRLSYVCTFVWHKPGGMQVVGLPQYNCEFAVYARRGAPKFIDTKAFDTCFEAPRGKHSEKPEAFYDVVRRVTAGRRLDMFNRRRIEGFDGWGKEAAAEAVHVCPRLVQDARCAP